jgi:hypothetical protein
MPKTKRMSKMRSKTMKMHKRSCEATIHSLNKWYEIEFEKLGWMVLAKNKGYNDKTTAYMKSLNRLKKCLKHKMTHIKEDDRLQDLQIMYHNVEVLVKHAEKDFQ